MLEPWGGCQRKPTSCTTESTGAMNFMTLSNRVLYRNHLDDGLVLQTMRFIQQYALWRRVFKNRNRKSGMPCAIAVSIHIVLLSSKTGSYHHEIHN